MRLISVAIVVAVAASVVAFLYDSPQRGSAGVDCEATAITEWTVVSGGNGHYYKGACMFDEDSWDEARDGAEALGGHLVTIDSGAENDFVFNLIDGRGFWNQDDDWCPGPFIGLWEPGDDAEPAGGWEWVTGEPFDFNNWADGEPNNHDGIDENRAAFGHSDCTSGDVPSDEWHDVDEFDEHPSYVIEWETAPPLCQSKPLVQWETAGGGNDHFYQAVCFEDGIGWDEAQEAAEALGGHLATNTSAAENTFVFGLVDSPEFWNLTSYNCIIGPWIGAYQLDGAVEPDGGWTWVTGEPFTYTNWSEGEPDNFSDDNRMAMWAGCPGTRSDEWMDSVERGDWAEVISYVIEWDTRPFIMGDADCDGDVDLDDLLVILGDAAGTGVAACTGAAGVRTVQGIAPGDADCDPDIDGVDGLHVLLYVAGLPEPAKPEFCPPVGHALTF